MNLPANIAAALAEQIESLADSLLGKPTYRAGHELRFRRKGSLAVAFRGIKRGRFYDHELGEGGDSLELVRQINGGTVSDAMRWARDWLGMAPSFRPAASSATIKTPPNLTTPDEAWRIKSALVIWRETIPMRGTIAEIYLRQRRIAPLEGVPDLRFHPSCPAGEGRRLPAMVAMMRDVQSNEPRAIHRTFLKPDGTGKDDAGKKMLGRAAGTVIKISSDAHVTLGLGLAEGIETAMSLMAYGWSPVWAAGSAGAIKTFPVLDGVETLSIFADSDDGGVGLESARSCATRWQASGRSVEIHRPPNGSDWNQIVQRVAA